MMTTTCFRIPRREDSLMRLFDAIRRGQWIFLGGDGDSFFNIEGVAVAKFAVGVGCTHYASLCFLLTVGDGGHGRMHR